jgi:protocatechuate 3,4-dioxygenase alpha subunit
VTDLWTSYGIAAQVSRGATPDGPTPSQTVGPYFALGMAWMGEEASEVVGDGFPGSVILTGHVFDGDGAPVPDAVVELWQADPSARGGSHLRYGGFARSVVDAGGVYRFRVLEPGDDIPYLLLSVFARGLLERLVTRVYPPGAGPDPLLDSLEPERRATLVASRAGDTLVHDLRLQGPKETVFLCW